MGHPARAMYASIAWANSWQLLISILYVMYNAQLTAFMIGVEWTNFASGHPEQPTKIPSAESLSSNGEITTRKLSIYEMLLGLYRRHPEMQTPLRKTLRVSAPVGIQRSSYFVSMPLRYGIPLIATMSLLHWLISQSLFVVATVSYESDGAAGTPIYTSAYSLQAMIVAICVGFALICALLVLGFRRYPNTIPLVQSCSAAISAACHPPEGDEDARFFPLLWGVVTVDVDGNKDSSPLHCSLSTSRDIKGPLEGKHKYA